VSGRRILQIASLPAIALVALAVVPTVLKIGGGDEVPVVEVRSESFARQVHAEGNLSAVKATPLSPPVSVRTPMNIAWLAPDGSRVSAGDVVVRFDPTDMEKNLEDGQADRSTAEQQTGKRQVQRDGMLDNLDRDARLAGRELEYAQEFQSKDPTIYSRSEIIESEIDEDLAQRRQEKAEGSRDIQGELAQADLDLLAIEKRKAELKIAEARDGLRSLEVEAPHDGILVFQRDWNGELPKVGDSVWPGRPLAEIPNLDEMEAEVFVLEADGGGLADGLPATVFLEAQPDRTFSAEIKKVDALAKPRMRGTPVQYFAVTLALERTDPEIMKPGQRVRAILTLDVMDDVLVVPRQSVFDEDGKKIVYRRNGSGFEPVEVTLGPSAPGRVVIEEGLEAGDVVALSDPTRTEEETSREKDNGNGSGPPGVGGAP
jgi:multidrug efflux pump subunit AcrA (membrane-fusion protein)